MMKVLRTPDSCFDNLPGYNYEPHYTTIKDDDGTEIRIHSIDEGPRDAEPILLMHGNPSWSYIWRKMIPGLLETGRRVIAVDLVGNGRSDKPAKKSDYTLARHVDWIEKWLLANDLNNITLVCQDWGGTIGLNVVADNPERFDRIVATNTGIPLGKGNKWLYWWLKIMKWMPLFPFKTAFRKAILNPDFSDEEFAAYRKAPFPRQKYQSGIRQFPQLITVFPDNPGLPQNLAAWEKLKTFEKPVITLFGNKDPISRGMDRLFQRDIRGAQGQNHKRIDGGGHFIQEDKPDELVAEIIPFLDVK
ncbi:haloalkane dehalogenase [Oceanicoccus sagamiensis]|nr:haloalkane dehalogenase [Oceanicoccus sagamiensis]